MKWTEKSLDELGYVSRGISRHRPRNAPHLYGGPYPFIQTSVVKHANLYIREYEQTYSEEGLAQSKLWPAGTLCITIAANIADTAILAFDACFPDSVIGFIPDPDKADVRFIKYLFDALLQKRFQSFSQGAAQDNLSMEKLLSIKFPVPNITTQKRIADILSTYDDLIENNLRRIELLEQSARLLYKEWFVHLRFPGHERVKIVDGVPEGWIKGKVADFFNTTSGGTPSRKNPEFFSGTINWVKTQELNDDYIFDTEEKISEEAIQKSSAKIYPENTLLVSIYAGTNIGRTGILAYPSASNQACVALLPTHKDANPFYAQLYFREIRNTLINIAQGSAQTNISQQTIRNLPMIMPSTDIMNAFISIVSPLYAQMKTLQLQVIKLKQARDLLLPRLMKGEITV
ncbi:restriction endonuclease subunit S [Thermoflavimicrobium dichotomicum]|uniref:Type I restriction enzyme, S subunit n=1 Tax=Thermoflavimicrobium dichotomicum TaxID=46223 RepID=A0A1I3U5D6_9BACL|nr:restriction endonuclease subunit S [Thermoflavimicrobium dichotomicum]SFJ78122.1 type I restriction enzyme, S subunit [Thermoflavimicrobium dichotomicum]